MDRKIKQMSEEDFDLFTEIIIADALQAIDDAELPEMSSESHWYINEEQAQQIIDTPRTILKEVDVFSDLTLPKAERIEHARKIIASRKSKKGGDSTE